MSPNSPYETYTRVVYLCILLQVSLATFRRLANPEPSYLQSYSILPCHFQGEFERAAEQYKRTLHLAQELGDRAVEAQACYSLGNTYTLLKDYATAVKYHMRHLAIAQELFDKVGEGRACW